MTGDERLGLGGGRRSTRRAGGPGFFSVTFVDGILFSHAGLGAGWGFADAAEAARPRGTLAVRAGVFAQIGRFARAVAQACCFR